MEATGEPQVLGYVWLKNPIRVTYFHNPTSLIVFVANVFLFTVKKGLYFTTNESQT